MKYKIKRGDEVVVIAGAHKGQRGKVLEVLRGKDRVVIEGVNMVKRHRKATKENDPDAGIVEREGSVHYSNVMKADRYDSRKSA
ncbi:MAG: 50S ribosomal protein L24 [Verrucomicrobiota bacterium JB024]|jgi:large subunit ribosomal protein L24|nr:50S ribosomal protein L24 [Verrucomicrobiota bacterium JB024]